MPRVPIPDDWDQETWECYILPWPSSVQWRGVLQGLITIPTRGRFWDERTGSIKAAQAIGLLIEEEFTNMQCDDLLQALQGIQTAIESIDTSQNTQVTIQNAINTNIALVATSVSEAIANQTQSQESVNLAIARSQATAYAWATTFTNVLAPTFVTNNYSQQLRPINPTSEPAPTTEETTNTGISNSLEDQSASELCKRVFWLIWNVREVFYYIKATVDFGKTGILAILGMISDAVSALGGAFLGQAAARRYLLPASALLQLTHLLAEMMAEGDFFDLMDEIDDTFTNHFDELFTQIFCAAANEDKTDAIQQMAIKGYWSNYLTYGDGVAFMTLLFNLSALGALYYEGTDLDPAPAVPAAYSYLCGETCDEGG